MTSSDRAKAPHAGNMVFALRAGVVLHVRDVANGRACGCVCPGCGAPLEAVNNVTKKMAHFRHATGADCATGYETALHLAGKEALLKLKRVALPEYRKTHTLLTSTSVPISEELMIPSAIEAADQAWEEVWQQGFRPDVVFQTGDQQLFIEIKVSHAVDSDKMVKIRRKGCSSIEIDLSRLEPEVLASQGAFDAFLTSSSESRTWLYSGKVPPLEAQIHARLEKRLAAFEEELKRQEQARLAEHERQKRQAAEWAEKRDQQAIAKQQKVAAERQRLEPYLKQLDATRDANRVSAREQQLAKRFPVPSLAGYRKLGINDLFMRVRWHWAFNATFEQWQAYTLDLIFPTDRPQRPKVLPHAIRDKVEAKFGVPEFIVQLREHVAKFGVPEALVSVRQMLGSPVPQALTAVEKAAIPQTDDAVTVYLAHLYDLGLLRRTERFYGRRGLTTCYAPRGRTVEEALSSFRREQEEEQQRRNVAQAQDRLAQLTKWANTKTDGMDRILAIRASESYVFEHGDEGKRCTTCYMFSVPSMVICPFCNTDDFLPPARIDSDRIRMNRHILASAPGVSSSLRSAPTLDLTLVQPYIARLAAEDASK